MDDGYIDVPPNEESLSNILGNSSRSKSLDKRARMFQHDAPEDLIELCWPPSY